MSSVDPYRYAAAGWLVFPVMAGGKAPAAGGNGHLDATTDAGQIARWQQSFPGCRWGVDLERSGLAVVDIDTHGVSGYASVEGSGLTQAGAQMQATPSGGMHLLYRLPSGAAPTRKTGALPGVDLLSRGYVVLYSDALDPAALVPAPAAFVDLTTRTAALARADYSGAAYEAMSPEDQAFYHAHAEAQVSAMLAGLAESVSWGEGEVDALGRGWEKGRADVALALHTLLQEGWSGFDAAELEARYFEATAGDATSERLAAKSWRDQAGRVGKPCASLVAAPDFMDLAGSRNGAARVPADATAPALAGGPRFLDDARLSEWLSEGALADFRWASSGAWHAWDGRVWAPVPEEAVTERVRQTLIAQLVAEANAGADSDRLKALSSKLAVGRLKGLSTLARGMRLASPGDFDSNPDLLSVQNGAVDLTTGDLRPHNRELLLTKIAAAEYRPGAKHPDWTRALEALDPEERDWLQLWAGQAASGHLQPDDLVLFCQGGGANGKSSVLGALVAALGTHAVRVPEKALTGATEEHSTSQTVLWGARLGLIEELPEGRQLSTKRLKDLAGTPFITARRMRQDDETHAATHALVVSTNYLPRVSETDHGTWRRLALLRFRRRFTGAQADVGLRARMVEGREGRAEAVLAWIVEGAVRFHARRTTLPLTASMAADGLAWRGEADQAFTFATEHLEFRPDAAMLSSELYAAFADWQRAHGYAVWNDQTFTARFGQHDLVLSQRVEKRKGVRTGGLALSRPRVGFLGQPDAHVTERASVWFGVAWSQAGTGWHGVSGSPLEPHLVRVTGTPVPPRASDGSTPGQSTNGATS